MIHCTKTHLMHSFIDQKLRVGTVIILDSHSYHLQTTILSWIKQQLVQLIYITFLLRLLRGQGYNNFRYHVEWVSMRIDRNFSNRCLDNLRRIFNLWTQNWKRKIKKMKDWSKISRRQRFISLFWRNQHLKESFSWKIKSLNFKNFINLNFNGLNPKWLLTLTKITVHGLILARLSFNLQMKSRLILVFKLHRDFYTKLQKKLRLKDNKYSHPR